VAYRGGQDEMFEAEVPDDIAPRPLGSGSNAGTSVGGLGSPGMHDSGMDGHRPASTATPGAAAPDPSNHPPSVPQPGDDVQVPPPPLLNSSF